MIAWDRPEITISARPSTFVASVQDGVVKIIVMLAQAQFVAVVKALQRIDDVQQIMGVMIGRNGNPRTALPNQP